MKILPSEDSQMASVAVLFLVFCGALCGGFCGVLCGFGGGGG